MSVKPRELTLSVEDVRKVQRSSKLDVESLKNDDESVSEVPYVDYRPDGLSARSTLINFLKGMVGPGSLSLPLALKQGGLIAGATLIIILGFINNYCMLQLVQSSQHLSRKKGRVLDYGTVAYESCAMSFRSLRRYHSFCNGSIVALQLGICSVLCVFLLEHIRQIAEHTGFHLSTVTWNCIVLAPLILSNIVRTLRNLVVLSIVGNICISGALLYVIQYLIRQPHELTNLPYFTSVDGVLVAACTVLYSYEGQALILPMENKIRSPTKMLGTFGVISQGMFFITIIYTLSAFLGYATYGQDVKGSITLNLPESTETLVIKCIFMLTAYAGFGIQQYVIVDMTWPWIRDKLGLSGQTGLIRDHLPEAGYRTCLLMFELMIAIVVPTLDELIPCVGASVGMLLALAFPVIIHTLTFAPEWSGKCQLTWNLSRNLFVLTIGLVVGTAGLKFNISQIIQQHFSHSS
ncbi:Aa-trans domain-containing protein [Aphelenchoides besseyi]|nr:Aa-trans domain-containing protein [Aphelenchoides besseyi]